MCQQDKTSEYEIWLTICSKNAAQHIINSLYVSSLSSKSNTIVIIASIVSCASIILVFVDGLEYAQTHLNHEMELFFTNYSTLCNKYYIKNTPQRKICRISGLDVKFTLLL